MKDTVITYLFFGQGRCEEALEYYKTHLGAVIGDIFRFNQSPDPVPEGMLAPGFEEKVMHASVTIGKTEFYASDGCTPDQPGEGYMLVLAVDTKEEADRIFAALADGGEVTMPLCETFWSEYYGMLKDKFGVGWMVNIPRES